MRTPDVSLACEELFQTVSPCETVRLLWRLNEQSLKTAYRGAVWRTHPDLFGHLPDEERRRKADAFIRVGAAYEALERYLARRRAAGAAARGARGVSRVTPRPGGHPGQPLPRRVLRLGEFLVCSGVAAPGDVARAVAWQRSRVPRLGEIATRWRWATEATIHHVLADCRPGEPLGACLIRHRILTAFTVKVLLGYQQKVRRPFGEYFLTQDLLSPAQLRLYLTLQAAHNACCRLRPNRAA